MTPRNHDHSFRLVPKIVEMVLSLQEVGICDADALDYVAHVWSALDISDMSLHFQDVRKATVSVLAHLSSKQSISIDLARDIADHWIHPLNFLDMTPISVSQAELQAERDRWLRDQW